MGYQRLIDIQIQREIVDYPMKRERYLSTWKVFRSLSNENIITAEHIIGLDGWKNIRTLLDLGCGDGLIAKEIILRCPESLLSISLVDPDIEMLDEAFRNVISVHAINRINKFNGGFEQYFTNLANQSDIIIAVHLLYLIPSENFQFLLAQLPPHKSLVIVIDNEESIFSKLWSRTAKKYIERSEFVRNTLDKLTGSFIVKKSIITSTLPNPLAQSSVNKDSLLSILSYSDFALMTAVDKKFVEDCVRKHIKNGVLECSSACYEIIKTA